LKLVAHSKYPYCKSSKCKGPVSKEGASSTLKKARPQLDKFEAKMEKTMFVRDFKRGER
jgi:hypothetical protein